MWKYNGAKNNGASAWQFDTISLYSMRNAADPIQHSSRRELKDKNKKRNE